jgi:predicted nucleic acid-binding protein
MSAVFADTSAIYAFLAAEDEQHERAKAILASLRAEVTSLVSSSYVIQETVALLQARIGIPAVRTFQQMVVPALEIEWVDQSVYQRAMAALLASGRRDVSLTDWTSFEIMRARGIERAFAFDRDFADQGFVVL